MSEDRWYVVFAIFVLVGLSLLFGYAVSVVLGLILGRSIAWGIIEYLVVGLSILLTGASLESKTGIDALAVIVLALVASIFVGMSIAIVLNTIGHAVSWDLATTWFVGFIVFIVWKIITA